MQESTWASVRNSFCVRGNHAACVCFCKSTVSVKCCIVVWCIRCLMKLPWRHVSVYEQYLIIKTQVVQWPDACYRHCQKDAENFCHTVPWQHGRVPFTTWLWWINTTRTYWRPVSLDTCASHYFCKNMLKHVTLSSLTHKRCFLLMSVLITTPFYCCQ
jgi:hypothetical protein